MTYGHPDQDSNTPARASARDQRLEIRCHSREKELLRQAAELEDRTLSNWLLHVALREARKTIAEKRPTFSPGDPDPPT